MPRAAARRRRLADGWLPILETRLRRRAPARATGRSRSRRARRGRRARELRPDRGRRAARPRGVTVRLTASPGAAAQLRFGAGGRRDGASATFRVARGATGRSTPRGSSAGAGAGARARPGGVRGRARVGRRVLAGPPRRGDDDRGARAAGRGRRPRAPRPEPAPDLALQHRQRVRGVLVPGGRRRRAGARRAGLRATSRARSSAPRSRGRPTPYPNWKMGEKLLASAAEVRLFDDRAFLARGDADAARLRRRARPADRPRPARAARAGALLVRHPRPRCSGSTRRRPCGPGSRRWAACGRRPGRRALAATCRRLAARLEDGLRARRARVGAAAARTARSSSRRASSTTRRRTAR